MRSARTAPASEPAASASTVKSTTITKRPIRLRLRVGAPTRSVTAPNARSRSSRTITSCEGSLSLVAGGVSSPEPSVHRPRPDRLGHPQQRLAPADRGRAAKGLVPSSRDGHRLGDSSRTHAKIPHDGFEIKLVRVGPRNWRAIVRLPLPGRWRLVVPNRTHLGFMVPPPTAWMRRIPRTLAHPIVLALAGRRRVALGQVRVMR